MTERTLRAATADEVRVLCGMLAGLPELDRLDAGALGLLSAAVALLIEGARQHAWPPEAVGVAVRWSAEAKRWEVVEPPEPPATERTERNTAGT